MSNQTLKFFGNQADYNKSDINNSCYFKKDGVLVIIDCGKGVCKAIKENGIAKDVKQVYQIITHYNQKHTKDMVQLFDYFNDELKIKPNLLNTISINPEEIAKLGLKEGRDFNFVEPLSKSFKWLNVLLVPNTKNTNACGLEINIDDKKIFLSADCKDIPFDITGYDEYYLDCSEIENKNFMDLDKIKELIKKNKIKKQNLFLMHIESQNMINKAKLEGFKVVDTKVVKEKLATKAPIQRKVAKPIKQTEKAN